MKDHDPAPLAHPVNTACARIAVGRTTFYELVASGEIRVFKVGNKTIVPESELRRFVESKMEAAA